MWSGNKAPMRNLYHSDWFIGYCALKEAHLGDLDGESRRRSLTDTSTILITALAVLSQGRGCISITCFPTDLEN